MNEVFPKWKTLKGRQPMSEKLGEKELVHTLNKVFDRYIPNAADDEAQDLAIQAHNQLKEIIEWWSMRNDWPKEIALKFGTQQKPSVTREWIKKWANFWNDDFYSHKTSKHVEPHIEAMLEELGIEIEEKEATDETK